MRLFFGGEVRELKQRLASSEQIILELHQRIACVAKHEVAANEKVDEQKREIVRLKKLLTVNGITHSKPKPRRKKK